MSNSKNEILNVFLGVVIPDEIGYYECREATFYDKSEARNLLPESEPQIYIGNSVVFSGDTKNIGGCVLGVVQVTERMCKGHFDWMPIMPLAIASQSCAQVCSLLILHISGSELIPLVVQVDQIKSIQTENTRYARLGDKLLVVGRYLKGRSIFHKISCDLYLNEYKIATMSEITFITTNKEYMLKKGGFDNDKCLDE